jgi:hypothetical protein
MNIKRLRLSVAKSQYQPEKAPFFWHIKGGFWEGAVISFLVTVLMASAKGHNCEGQSIKGSVVGLWEQ